MAKRESLKATSLQQNHSPQYIQHRVSNNHFKNTTCCWALTNDKLIVHKEVCMMKQGNEQSTWCYDLGQCWIWLHRDWTTEHFASFPLDVYVTASFNAKAFTVLEALIESMPDCKTPSHDESGFECHDEFITQGQ